MKLDREIIPSQAAQAILQEGSPHAVVVSDEEAQFNTVQNWSITITPDGSRLIYELSKTL